MLTTNSIPITNAGPGDNINWEIKCGESNIIHTETWSYSTLPNLTNNPINQSEDILPFIYTFTNNSCNLKLFKFSKLEREISNFY